MSEFENERGEDLFSKSVRSGKRTYFFDVRSTKSSDYYLTITESKKRFGQEGQKPFYEKHKIYLYKEDFEKFVDGLNEAITAIRTNNVGAVEPSHDNYENTESVSDELNNSSASTDSGNTGESNFTDIKFEDLK